MVNICGLSDYSLSALQKYVVRNNIPILAICETVKDVKCDYYQGHKSISSLNHRDVKVPVANEIPWTKPYELEYDQLYDLFAIFTTKKKVTPVGAVYVPSEHQTLQQFPKNFSDSPSLLQNQRYTKHVHSWWFQCPSQAVLISGCYLILSDELSEILNGLKVTRKLDGSN